MKMHNYYVLVKVTRFNNEKKIVNIDVNFIISTEKDYLTVDLIEKSKFGFITDFCENNNIPKDSILNIVICSINYIGKCTKEELYS